MGDEARAVRERVGIIDLSSFGKIAVGGPGASALLQRVAANDVDRPVGSVVYTPCLDERGGHRRRRHGHAPRPRTASASSPAPGSWPSDLAWLRAHSRRRATSPSRDVSAELATLGLWGPRARDILAAATGDDVERRGPPAAPGASIRVGGAPVLAARISYAGELGWELT